MEITYYGHNCFRLMERGMAAIVADPFGENVGYEAPRLRADIVTVSSDNPGYNALDTVKGNPVAVRSAGEYEIGGVFITGVATWNPKVNPENTHYNTVYVYNFNRATVCHLGTLDYVPSRSVIEALGPIDVLLIPVGGGYALNSAQASEVISLIEPGIVVPMHYADPENTFELEDLEKFLKEMGVTGIETESSLKVTSSGLPDSTQVVVLDRKA